MTNRQGENQRKNSGIPDNRHVGKSCVNEKNILEKSSLEERKCVAQIFPKVSGAHFYTKISKNLAITTRH